MKNLSLPIDYQDYLKQEESNMTIFGEVNNKNNHLTNDDDKFKHVLHYGIDYANPKGKRSLYDFSKNLNFNDVVLKDKALLDYSVLYASGMLCFFYELDETYMPHHCAKKDFDDSLPDLHYVISRIKNAYIANNMPLIVQQKNVYECLSWIDSIEEMMSEDESILKKAHNEMKKFRKLLLSLYLMSQ